MTEAVVLIKEEGIYQLVVFYKGTSIIHGLLERSTISIKELKLKFLLCI
jgi:hypothetical protein